MSEESNKQCSICFRRYTEFGHPAEPVRSGRCCNACNDLVVIPARLRAMREATVAPPALTAVSEGHQVVHTCSFCGKSNLTTKVMVAGDNATICNECIAVCVKIEREWNERKVAEAGGEMTAAPSAKAPRRRKAKPTGKAK